MLENTVNKVPLGIEDKNPLQGDLLVTETPRADAGRSVPLHRTGQSQGFNPREMVELGVPATIRCTPERAFWR